QYLCRVVDRIDYHAGMRRVSGYMWRAALVLCASGLFGATAPVSIADHSTGIGVTFEPDGQYAISTGIAGWNFSGSLGQPATAIVVQKGSDSVAAYQEILVDYVQEGSKQASIRVYSGKPVVLFNVKYLHAASNTATFPKLTSYPGTAHHVSYKGQFGKYSFDDFGVDGPWVFFDDVRNTFILSPASDFLISATTRSSSKSQSQEIASGIDSRITMLPEGFAHSTILVVEQGINRAFETWGSALARLQGKAQVANGNDGDPILAKVGYWTDNGATYYYKYEPSLGYEKTLLAIRDEFLEKGVPLGYMQLDSWFYPKGAHADWKKFDGIYEYVADKSLFPDGLKAFQQHLGIPLVTHSRWIDPESPYHSRYRMSGNVVVDPVYWGTVASYLHDAHVLTYEQDWLDERAQSAFNLHDPAAFMDEMAQALKEQKLTIQYCMPLPRHYLQSTRYENVTTIRTSGDRFGRDKWDEFLYDSRLASSLGVWPWSDVFMSDELDNLLVSTLSAGPVGVGDRIGTVNRENLLRAVRADGVIVKPDVSLVPTDQAFVEDAQTLKRPMLASAYTDFGTLKAFYVLAYARGAEKTVAFTPASLGLHTRAYVFDYFAHKGTVLDPDKTFMESLEKESPEKGYAYFIVVPLGQSGIAFLGDRDQFVSLGKQRISQLSDNGTVRVTIQFAHGENSRTVHGYSPIAPVVTSIKGKTGASMYDSAAHRFTVSVLPDSNGSAELEIRSSQR
ncbi:MAG TPA: hypothetical protein VIH54_19830, partial [Chthoniobacterales bacterium]